MIPGFLNGAMSGFPRGNHLGFVSNIRKSDGFLTGGNPTGIFAGSHVAVGQNQWYHFGVGAPMLVHFGGD